MTVHAIDSSSIGHGQQGRNRSRGAVRCFSDDGQVEFKCMRLLWNETEAHEFTNGRAFDLIVM